MWTYIAKRILWMIPTFFAISLIIFLILNLAPGKPGGTLASGAEGQEASGSSRESYRVFKSQFNLDKPVLFNTRYALSDEQVEKCLNNYANESGKVPMKEVIKSQELLEDYGQYSIPSLIRILKKSEGNQKFRAVVLETLLQNAQRYPINAYAEHLDEKTKKINNEIDIENNQIRTFACSKDASVKDQEKVAQKWYAWYGKHEDRFKYSFWQKVGIFFTDTRFFKYWASLIRFDFGVSHIDKKPVMEKILSKLQYSLCLSVPAVIFAYIISVPLGVFSAVKQNSKFDRVCAVILFMLYSLPSFFVATVLLYFFSQGGDFLKIFPTGGFQSPSVDSMTTWEKTKDIIWHIVLPLICMTYGSFASLSRYARTGMLDVIRSDYVRTARAKGLSEFVVVVKHAMRNGMIPIITLLGTLLPVIIGGSVIIEYIFGIPGMGQLSITSIYNRDYNMIMGIQLISAILVLIGILLSDLLYALVDPRISFK